MPVHSNGLHRFSVDIEISYITGNQRYKFITFGNQEAGFVFLLQAVHLGQQPIQRSLFRSGSEVFVLVQRPLQISLVDGFQQVIDTVDLEGFQGIFIISRGKDDGTGDFGLFEDGERRPVGQVDVHKNKVGHRVLLKPLHTFFDGLKHGDDFRLRARLLDQRLKSLCRNAFVFDDQRFHNNYCFGSINGKVTSNTFPSSLMPTSTFHFRR